MDRGRRGGRKREEGVEGGRGGRYEEISPSLPPYLPPAERGQGLTLPLEHACASQRKSFSERELCSAAACRHEQRTQVWL